MKAIRILGLAVVGTAAVLLLSVSPASAQPVAGAYYAGEITGCSEPPCGSVHFTVSGDASKVQGFTASYVPGEGPLGEGCLFQGPQQYPFDLDIEEDDSFGPGLDFFEVSGSFLSEGNAEGTLRLAMVDCDTGVLPWTAVVSSPPVGGIAELPDVSDSSARNYVALAGLAAAALVALTTGAWHARRRRLG
ncbi:MAG: hypothetical protein AMJ38_00245 [Dehalococcoidia bacterium DG_22]|nr:MAG: hypothetical protein AMJ38_00245 [Dehalococcoidia bacterium DG_22]